MKRSNSSKSQTESVSNILHGLMAGTFGVALLAMVFQAAVALA